MASTRSRCRDFRRVAENLRTRFLRVPFEIEIERSAGLQACQQADLPPSRPKGASASRAEAFGVGGKVRTTINLKCTLSVSRGGRDFHRESLGYCLQDIRSFDESLHRQELVDGRCTRMRQEMPH